MEEGRQKEGADERRRDRRMEGKWGRDEGVSEIRGGREWKMEYESETDGDILHKGRGMDDRRCDEGTGWRDNY